MGLTGVLAWASLAGCLLLLTACASSVGREIVFVSNADGDQELFLIDVDSGSSVKLTDNNARDFAPVWSGDRKRVAYLTDESGSLEVSVIDRRGSAASRITAGEAIEDDARLVWSPEGNRLALVSSREGNAEVYVTDLDSRTTTRITFNEAGDRLGAWSPDGEWLVFYGDDADSEPGLWLRNPSGVNLIRLTQGMDRDPVWSPDGERIAFVRTEEDNEDIYVVSRADTGTWRDRGTEARLTQAPEPDTSPNWSPDSKSLVFVSERDGNAEIYAMRSDGARQQRLTNNGQADLDPVWSPDGKQIAFVSYLYGPGEIFMMETDGRNQQRLTNNSAEETSPDW